MSGLPTVPEATKDESPSDALAGSPRAFFILISEPMRVYAGGTSGRGHDHRHFDCAAVAGGPSGPRGGAAGAVQEQHQATRPGLSDHESLTKRYPTGGCGFGWTGDADRGTDWRNRPDGCTTSCPSSSRRRCTTLGQGCRPPRKTPPTTSGCQPRWGYSIVPRGGGRWPTRGRGGPAETRSSTPARWWRWDGATTPPTGAIST